MANYFDNQEKWSWQISDKEVLVTTDHGNHTHTLDVTDVPIGDMVNHTGQMMGDAHRAASHDFKEDSEIAETEEIAEDVEIEEDSLDGGEDCEDGLDL